MLKKPSPVQLRSRTLYREWIAELCKENLSERGEKIGKEYEVLIENKTFDGKYYIGRTYMDIPETDGLVFIPNTEPNLENTWVKTKIKDVKNYDSIGESQ